MYEQSYKEYIERLEYEPRETQFIDVWSHQKEDGAIVREVEEGRLQDANVENWLSKTHESPASGVDLGGFRMIVYNSKVGDGFDHKWKLPFSRNTFENIMDQWKLPRTYPRTLVDLCAQTARFSFRGEAGTPPQIGYTFSTHAFSGQNYCLAIRFDIQNGITHGILRGTMDGLEDWLIPQVKSCRDLSFHPLLVPILTAELDQVDIVNRLISIGQDMRAAEFSTGQHHYFTYGPLESVEKPVNTMEINFVSLTKELNSISTSIGNTLLKIECQGLHLQKIGGFVDELPLQILDSTRKERVIQGSQGLKEKLEYLMNQNENVLIYAHAIERRVQTQLAVIYNFMAQRDNKLNIEIARDSKSIAVEGKRDSSAMKTIAVLTIVFLPGTFIAALFSMPLFNWQADTGDLVVSTRFWVYWAISIPLTVVVVLLWIIWIRMTDRRRRKEDEERAQASDPNRKQSTGRSSTHSHTEERQGENTPPHSGGDSTTADREVVATKRCTWLKFLKPLVQSSRAALGLRVEREKQNIA